MPRYRLVVNGKQHLVDASAETPLLWILRDDLGLTGTKYGCGQSLCGACTVHLDGAAVRSCQTTIQAADGHRITTIEGLAPRGDHPLQRAWAAEEVPAVRLLPVRAADGGRGAARQDAAPDRRRHRRGHGRHPLPLRDLQPDPSRHPPGRGRHAMTAPARFGRRRFLQATALGGAGLWLEVHFPAVARAAEPAPAALEPNAWLRDRSQGAGHHLRRQGGDGAGRPHLHAHAGGRGAGGRLEGHPRGPGRRPAQVRAHGHRWLAQRPQQLPAAAPGRGGGARAAGHRGGPAVEGGAGQLPRRAGERGPPAERAAARVRRAGGRGQPARGAEGSRRSRTPGTSGSSASGWRGSTHPTRRPGAPSSASTSAAPGCATPRWPARPSWAAR